MTRLCIFFVFILHALIVKAEDYVIDANGKVQATIIIENHKFKPDLLDLPAGKKIRLTVENKDETAEEFESYDLKREKIVPSKGQAVIILAPLKPGSYNFFGCFNKESAQGTMNVK